MDRDEMSKVYRGPAIDASYQVSVHLAEGFQRRRLKCEKLTDDGRQTPSDDKSSLCLWQGELKKSMARREKTFKIKKSNGCFLVMSISPTKRTSDKCKYKHKINKCFFHMQSNKYLFTF